MIELLGIFAAITELLGLYLLGKKISIGFLINLIGNVSWILYAICSKHTYGLLLVCSVAFVLNIKGYLTWSKNDN